MYVLTYQTKSKYVSSEAGVITMPNLNIQNKAINGFNTYLIILIVAGQRLPQNPYHLAIKPSSLIIYLPTAIYQTN